MADIEVGQIVRSKQGRDKRKFYFVIEVLDEKYVLLSDGDKKTINSPKKKKNKHLIVYKMKNDDIIDRLRDDNLDDIFIRKSLTSFIEKGKEANEQGVRSPNV